MSSLRIVVVGAGSWGSTFASLLAENGHSVTLASRDPEQASAIEATGRNPRYVPRVDLTRVSACALSDAPFAETDALVVAVPSRAFREVITALPDGGTPLLSLVKGLDPVSGERLSKAVGPRPVAVLSGPNHSEEIAEGLPAAAVIASEDEAFAVQMQSAVMSPRFRVYVSSDLAGVELCGAAKNVIALAAGAVDGIGLGTNAKAAVMTRGLTEMSRLGSVAGARIETFAGLAGMGDLIVTCWSHWSRNRRAGELIARGYSPTEAEREIAMAVEGLATAPVLRDFGRRLGIDLPITEAVCELLAGRSAREALVEMMGRKPTAEYEHDATAT
ncbi:MAG: NAD(P)-dependent glycerol-3-phosphate dehydrogenase [Actinomycetota bacterium]|nr:NAD(P)-dependent glycerol-3-phosphate dehydrogenase [Actinomycetota bacterium]